jgi:NADPH2:quinone reductase
MKAIRVHEFGPPEVMKLENVPDLKPGPGQVLVRIHAAGVNPVDTYIRSGVYAGPPPLPYTPGGDAGGVVAAIGKGVRSVKFGDRVYICGTVAGPVFGAYAELALCAEQQVHQLPDNVSFAQGAAVGIPYATAYRALFQKAQAKCGETVLVHGASGGVGTAALQLAVARGMRVIGTAGTERGLQHVRDQGAQHVLDHRQPRSDRGKPGYLDELTKLTDGRGPDVILEMLANVNLGKDLTVLANHGRVVVIGSRGNVEINPRDLMRHDAVVLGMMLMSVSVEETSSIYAALAAGLANGNLRPVVGQEMPLADAPRAHETVMKPGAYGKIVLVP